VCDVFLLDSDFKIERPKRYYRQGLNVFHLDAHKENIDASGSVKIHAHDGDGDNVSVMKTISSRLSQLLHIGHHRNNTTGREKSQDSDDHDDSPSSPSSSSNTTPSRAPTPMLDPSTNTNPLVSGDGQPEQPDTEQMRDRNVINLKQKKRASDVSKHTFYVENSQMRLKLVANNEVRNSFCPGVVSIIIQIILGSGKCCSGSLLLRKLPQPPITPVKTDLTALHQFG